MTEPALTIGMPAYNGASWIRAAVASLQAQTFRDFRLVICDNASRDETFAICRQLAADDPRIEVRQNAVNLGVFRNYDRVFEGCTTPYFKWASCNDLCAPTFLERCIAVLEAEPRVALAYPRTTLFDDDPVAGTPYADDLHVVDERPSDRFRHVLKEIRLNNAFNGVTRTAILRRTGLNQIFEGSDVVLLAEIAFSGFIWRLPEYLFYRRVHPAATAARKDEHGRKEFFAAEGRDVLATPRIDRSLHCLAVAWNAPVPAVERARSVLHAARRSWWSRQAIWHELSGLLRQRFLPGAS
ncbi:MAG: glycosyltransferase family 2 protein [Gammaproteobacteria bacterium]